MAQISLSDEDIKFLSMLDEYTFLDRDLIQKYVYQSVSNIGRKLTNLKDSGYIQDFKSLFSNHYRPKKVYSLTDKGSAVVKEVLGVTNYRTIRKLPVTYLHTLEVARTVLAFKNSGENIGMMLKEFMNERSAYFEYGASKNQSIRPDAMFVVGFEDSEEENIGVLLETEKTKTKRSVIKEKMAKYKDFFHDEEIRNNYIDQLSMYSEVNDWILLYVASDSDIERYTKNLLLRQKPKQGEEPTKDKPGIDFPTLLTNLEFIEQNPYQKNYFALDQENSSDRFNLDDHL
ncbi:replication-relaxation family protein (plasmid) [Staphylococcus aureus]|uniref:replication-relaxation family protein n=1 Tax=Staphylococcus TaxID=1279 RepID=UPI001951F30C|nr:MULTISPECIES: replication-relaxation family protein [Staphylococcus]MCQ9841472.1 replication-relaxation family protein [Staphylococcus aureus]WEH49719.1 replication-relaxation family protein [Staphylococcus aureus]